MKLVYLIVFILMLCLYTSCKPDTSISNAKAFKIDTTIKTIALKEIWNSENSNCDYSTKLNAEFFENDSLVGVYKDSANDTFWGRYWWHNDTLSLTGNVGVLRAIGFIADIYSDATARVFVNQCSHDSKNFKLRLSDTMTQCAKVPCIYSELKISSMPDSTKDEAIYGFVSFKSSDYYYQLDSEASKLRTNMTFYFKACNFNIELQKLNRK